MAWGDTTAPIESWQQKRDREGRRIASDYDSHEGRMGEQADAALREARSGEASVAQQQLRQGLGQARRQQAAQSVGRGSNALGQRAATYAGGQMYGQANASAASLRGQEMQAARMMAADTAARQGEMGLQERALWQQKMAQTQAHDLARDQFAADEEQRGWDRANQVVGTMANMGSAAAGGMSDERMKTGIDERERQAAALSSQLDAEGAQTQERLREPPPVVQVAPPTDSAPWWMYRAEQSRPAPSAGDTIRSVGDSFQTGAQLRQQALGTKGEDKYEQLFDSGGGGGGGGMMSMMSDYRSKSLSDYRTKDRVSYLSDQLDAEGAKTRSRLGLGGDDRVSRLSALLDAEGAKTDAKLAQPSPRGAADMEAARVSEELDREADETMRQLQAHRYQYRPEAQAEGAPPGDRAGIMAQDLERTPLGQNAVQEDERGVKYLDVPQTTSITAGLVGRAGRRLDELEERLARIEGRR